MPHPDRRSCTTPRCGQPAIANRTCRRCYTYIRRHGHPPDLTGPQVGDPAGHGTYGRMTRQQDSALCHECGGWYASVASHAHATHGLTAAEYRSRYGLARRQPLVSLGMSAAASARSAARVGSAAWQRLEARRDPAAASRSRDQDTHTPRPPVRQRSQARAAALSASQAQPHLCRICATPIPGWRGSDDGRTLCGRNECREETIRRAAAAGAATTRAKGRPLTDVEVAELRALSGTPLAATIRRLYRTGVRQRAVAEAMGVSANTVCRIAPYSQK